MGSKHRLLPWIHGVLRTLDFETAADPFLGSGCVAYLLKCMGKRVVGSDFLNFPTVIAKAAIENNGHELDGPAMKRLLQPLRRRSQFIERTFGGIFFTRADLQFLDRICNNVEKLDDVYRQSIARAALIRSCLKKQPRGVFTVGGDRYDDGRLKLSIEEHSLEQVAKFNSVVFSNGRRHTIRRGDVFALPSRDVDLVYLDPPYVPRADDNCYMKRYHFLEGLSCYWRGVEIMPNTKVKKIAKPFTPFSYRHTALDAFDMERLPRKKVYAADDVQKVLDEHFDDGLLISRLFLALSKDEFTAALRGALGGAGSGITRYRANKARFIDALVLILRSCSSRMA